jgi:group I intron endonuclease
MFGIIYKMTNLINGKSYIGQTIRDPKIREKEHARMDGNDCPLFYAAIAKYGIENFKFKEICYANNVEELNNREKFCIKIFKTKKPYGYNLNDGGANYFRTEEMKKAISETLIGRYVGEENPFFGKKHTDEFKKRQSLRMSARTGWFHTEETKNKIGESQVGKTILPESIEKMTQSLIKLYSDPKVRSKSRKAQKSRKPILCHQNGIIYDSIRHAAKELGLPSKDKISCVLKGIHKQYKGFTFSIVKENL